MQLFARLQQLETLQEVVEFQQLAELVQDVRVAQEVLALGWAVLHERPLYFFEHAPELLFSGACDDGGGLSVEAVGDVGDVFVVLVEFQSLEYLLHLGGCHLGHVADTLLLQLHVYPVVNVLRYIRGLLRLELGEPLVEVVDALVGVVGGVLARTLFV